MDYNINLDTDIPYSYRRFYSKGFLYITATMFNKNLGMLAFECKDNIVYIRYLQVSNEYRNIGIGTELIDFLNNYCKSNNIDGIVFSYFAPLNEINRLNRFLIKNGFMIPQYHECIMTIDLFSLNNSFLGKLPDLSKYLLNRMYYLDKLPAYLECDYKYNIKPNIMHACSFEGAKGEIISSASVCLSTDNSLSSYVIITMLDDELYLNSVYLEKNNGRELIALLQFSFNQLKKIFPNKNIIKTNIITYQGYHLFKKLTEGGNIRLEPVVTTYKVI